MMFQVLAAVCVVPGLLTMVEVAAVADVPAPAGRLVGLELDVLGRTVNAFLGIPFAQPPVGERRFKRAEPMEPWGGVYNATRKPDACYQDSQYEEGSMWALNTPISEDCLYLNVWQPTPVPTGAAVMVWIYGGGYQEGSSALDPYDGRYLAATEGVIVVGINYRVGTLGFLYAGTDDAPGNVGLSDQVQALQWVHDNIASFGGDPGKVTIFGESSGGVSIGYHLMSPGSWDLFSRAILQSGTGVTDWGRDSKAAAYDKTIKFAQTGGCKTDKGLTEMLACLRDKDVQQLLSSAIWFYPVEDGVFIPQSPSVALHNGAFKKADILIGSNENEGMSAFIIYASPGFSKDTDSLITKEQFLEGIPWNVPVLNKFAVDAAAFQYTDWERLDQKTMYRDALDDLYSDFYYICPDVNTGRAHVKKGATVYMYRFAHFASNSPYPAWVLATHGDEIQFVFGLPLNTTHGFTEGEKNLARRMMRHWANFAKTGDPNDNDGAWSAFNETDGGYMVLDILEPRIQTGPSTVNCAFWVNYVNPLRNKTEALLKEAAMAAQCDTASGAPGHHRLGTSGTIVAFVTLVIMQLAAM